MSTSTLLVINSANRSTDSKSSSDFNYDIGQTIEAASIAIKGISIPVTQYNVISPFNILYYYVDDNLYQVSFQPGQYSLAEMLVSIEAQFLASAAITVTFTQDPHTQKITFATAVPVKFYSQMESEGIYRLLTLLGLPAESTPTLYVTTLTFPYLPELQGLGKLYVQRRLVHLYHSCQVWRPRNRIPQSRWNRRPQYLCEDDWRYDDRRPNRPFSD